MPRYIIGDNIRKELRDRFTYHPPFGDQTLRYQEIREKANELATVICQCTPPGREQATALTELVRVTMIANSAIAIGEKDLSHTDSKLA